MSHRIGFAVNPTKPDAIALQERAVAWCRVRGIDHWVAPAGDREAAARELGGTDLVVVLGGDGTFLRAVVAVAGTDVPILGVNLGKIGFLSKAEAPQLEAILEAAVGGSTPVEERMMLEARILHRDGVAVDVVQALNDVVIARGALARVCHLEVAVDDSHLATFIADGLVVASPTGSTGYSFSAGGPILDPTSRNLIVTPIAAYLATIRSVVVSPHHVIRCRVVDAYEALASIDGWEDRALSVGDVVEVRPMERPVRFLDPVGSLPFWDLVRQKVELLPS